jgi:hypothetical protein
MSQVIEGRFRNTYFCKENCSLVGKQFESDDDINTAMTASLHRQSKDEYRVAIDRLPHRWEKFADSAGDYTG